MSEVYFEKAGMRSCNQRLMKNNFICGNTERKGAAGKLDMYISL